MITTNSRYISVYLIVLQRSGFNDEVISMNYERQKEHLFDEDDDGQIDQMGEKAVIVEE